MRAEGRVGFALPLAWIIAIIQSFTLLLAGIWIATRPGIFDRYYGFLVRSPSPSDAHEIVSWLKTDQSKEELFAHVVGRQLTERELNHYADVRVWAGKVPRSILWCAISMMLMYLSVRKLKLLPLIERRALCFMALLLGGCVAFAVWDWRIFFTWVHYPLFGSTSWRFPRGSYSLQLFPSSFWSAAGILVTAPALLVPILILALRSAGEKKAIEEESPE